VAPFAASICSIRKESYKMRLILFSVEWNFSKWAKPSRVLYCLRCAATWQSNPSLFIQRPSRDRRWPEWCNFVVRVELQRNNDQPKGWEKSGTDREYFYLDKFLTIVHLISFQFPMKNSYIPTINKILMCTKLFFLGTPSDGQYLALLPIKNSGPRNVVLSYTS